MRYAGAVVLRPEPGAARTAGRLEALGVVVQRCPLFVVKPVAWTPPDPTRHDALLLTSANAVRHAGSGLQALSTLPVLAVGAATAAAARAAGLTVIASGVSDAAAVVDHGRALGFARPLHLAGRDRMGAVADAITVYASDPIEPDAAAVQAWAGRIALLHSPRAARRFAGLVDQHRIGREQVGVAALSAAVADAAGGGWATRAVADRPDDAGLAALVAPMIDRLIDRPRPPADKQAR